MASALIRAARGGQPGAGGQAVQVGRTVAERFEQTELARGEQVLGGHEPGASSHDRSG